MELVVSPRSWDCYVSCCKGVNSMQPARAIVTFN